MITHHNHVLWWGLLKAQQLAGHWLRRGLCWRVAPDSLTAGLCCQWSQADFHRGQSTTVEPINFMRHVYITRIYQTAKLLVAFHALRYKNASKAVLLHIICKYIIKDSNLYIFPSKNVKITYRSFHPSGVFSVAPVVDNKQSAWSIWVCVACDIDYAAIYRSGGGQNNRHSMTAIKGML